MKDSNETIRPAPAQQERRKSSLLVALLFLVTLGGVFGAKLATEAKATPGPDDPSGLHRRAVQDALSFDGRLDRGAVHVGSDGLVHLELVATGATLPERALVRQPTDVVVVLDRSGSMGGDPMTKAIASIRELLDQLGPEDRFALVTYANDAEVALPLERGVVEVILWRG